MKEKRFTITVGPSVILFAAIILVQLPEPGKKREP